MSPFPGWYNGSAWVEILTKKRWLAGHDPDNQPLVVDDFNEDGETVTCTTCFYWSDLKLWGEP